VNGERTRAALRAALLAWLLVALSLLAWMLLNPGTQADERAGLSPLVPLYFLSFPLGHVGVAALSWLKVQLYTGGGTVLEIRSEGLLLWAALTGLGLLQWFVLLPWAARQCRRVAQFLSRRFLAR
jgi:hypothetical protein